MINAIRSYFNPPPPTVVEEKPFDSDEIKRRVDNFADQARDYLVALHTPTEFEKKDLEELLIDCPTERFRKDMTRSCYGCWAYVKINPLKSGGLASATCMGKARSRWGGKQRTIYLHPLMLLKPTDLPQDLRLSERNDPLLDGNDYYIRVLEWLCEKFNLEEKDFGELENFRILFQTYFKFYWKTPEGLIDVQNFALAHEVGHLHHKHTSYARDIILSIVLTCCVTVVLWINTSLLLVIAGAVTTYLISSVGLRCLRLLYYRHQEKVADLVALKLVTTTKGAEIIFETFHKVAEFVWKNRPWPFKILYTLLAPEVVFPLSHPTPKDRLAYIKEAHL